MRAWLRLRSRWHRRVETHLARRLVANVAGIGLLAALAIYLALTTMVWVTFGRLEDEAIATDIHRAETWLADLRASHLGHARDWAISDTMYRYLGDFDPHFQMAYLTPDSFVNVQTDGMAFVRFDGSARGFFYDGAARRMRPELGGALLAEVNTPALRARLAARREAAYFLRFNGQLYLAAITPVCSSRPRDPPPGYLAFLRRVDATALGAALQLPAGFDFTRPGDAALWTRHPHAVAVATPVRDAAGHPLAMLRFSEARKVMAAGAELRNLVLVAVLALVLALLLVISRRIATLVLDPVRRLHDHVAAMRNQNELVALAGPTRNDEIGALQRQFNELVAERQRLRAENEAQSFALGRRESSAGLMHNVKNSLSPVAVIVETLAGQLAAGLPDETRRALAELADPATDPARRRRLAHYVGAAHEAVDAGQRAALGALRDAGRSLGMALAVIEESRVEAGVIDYAEPCALAPILDAGTIPARFVVGASIAVSVDCPPDLAVRGNRLLLGQVFENLVTNAAEAICARGGGAGRIRIVAQVDARADAGAGAGVGACTITVTDDGEGFAAGGGPQLFARGFSTRTTKSGGLGLHWCANTLGMMEGAVAITSPGRGAGACVCVTLPLARKKAA